MKRLVFYIAAIISIYLLFNIVNILLDFDRLTNYGLGYLVGYIIWLILSLSITYITRKNRFKSSKNRTK